MTLRVSTPADILAYIPHALGFAPAACFVLLTMRGTRLGATLRLDAPTDVPPLDFAQKITTFLAADTKATGTLCVVYTDTDAAPGEPRPFHDHLEAIIGELDLARMPLRDAWIVTPTHWRNLLCGEDCGECVPQPLEAITDSITNATMILHGSSYGTGAPAPATFTGPADTKDRILAALPTGTDESAATARALWAETLDSTDPVDPATALTLTGNLHHPYVRDMMAYDLVSDGTDSHGDVFLGLGGIVPDWEKIRRAETILNQLVTAAPDGFRAPMLTLLGWIEFYRGSSTLAGEFFDLALKDTPDYRLAQLLSEVIHRGTVAGVAQNPATAYRRLA